MWLRSNDVVLRTCILPYRSTGSTDIKSDSLFHVTVNLQHTVESTYVVSYAMLPVSCHSTVVVSSMILLQRRLSRRSTT